LSELAARWRPLNRKLLSSCAGQVRGMMKVFISHRKELSLGTFQQDWNVHKSLLF